MTLLALACGLLARSAAAQDPRHFPLDPRQPAGKAAHWNVLIHRGLYGYMQPVRVTLPTAGDVTFYDGGSRAPLPAESPQARLMVGHTYRIRISGMPEFPGVELYPTIELLDRLHPPEGETDQWPIPIDILVEEIETALEDRMVTKVIFLEQPDLAAPFDQQERIHVEELPTAVNLLEAADRLGRPVAILRLGGRIPDLQSSPDELFGTGGPVLLTPPTDSVPLQPAP